MSDDIDYCEACGEHDFHMENSDKCFMFQEWKKQVATLNAEVVNREGEKQEMREVIDRLKAEVESYKRAKAENDERFQLEAGALRLDLERERAANAKLREALERIKDGGLPQGVLGGVVDRMLAMCSIATAALHAAKQDEGKKSDSRCPCWPGCEASDEGNV